MTRRAVCRYCGATAGSLAGDVCADGRRCERRRCRRALDEVRAKWAGIFEANTRDGEHDPARDRRRAQALRAIVTIVEVKQAMKRRR